MEWFLANWETVLLVVFGLGLIYLGLNIRRFLTELHDLTNGIDEFVGYLCQAAEDDKLTKEEWVQIKNLWMNVVKEGKDVAAIFTAIGVIIARIRR